MVIHDRRLLPPAERLRLDLRVEGARLIAEYDVDGQFTGQIRATYPFSLDAIDRDLTAPIGVGLAVFLGQLCLARRIELDFPATPAMVEGMLPLAEMLYDIRCWKDERDLLPLPELICRRPGPPSGDPTPGVHKRSVLLWSGGKDSTLSAITLRKNGYDVRPLHITANARVEGVERQAVDALAEQLGLGYQVLGFEFPGYLELSGAYARTWDQFPYYNTVAFGRDLALALLACIVVRRERAAHLSIGHENDCKNAYLRYQGKVVPRNDVESTRGALALERYIQRFLLPAVSLLPPLAALPEFRVLHELLVNYPDIMTRVSFCFWGDNCGRCSKCLRYSLAQRVLGREGILSFSVNPLEGDHCPELTDYLAHWDDESVLFRKPVLYCLGRLIERGDVRPGEAALLRFRDEVYPHLAEQLDALEAELMGTYSDPQLPPDFAAP